MKKNRTFKSLTRTLKALPRSSGAANLFAWGSRRRRRGTTSAYLIAGGIVAGAAALLLNPWSGRNLRSRVGNVLGGGIGKVLGAQLAANPVGTTKAVRKTQELLGINQ
jgi:hypothetical protein